MTMDPTWWGTFRRYVIIAAFLYPVGVLTGDGDCIECNLTIHFCAGEGAGLTQEPIRHPYIGDYQRKAYGSFLVNFSYLLSRVEYRTGTPEWPFSQK
jgi:hypothetical protein